jgi:diketogulonate reductase-like aldo/keto reductase
MEMEFREAGGARIPKVGLGTWRVTGEECVEAVSTALELGYRHVDTAQVYENERQVGRAIRESDVPREEVFLTTKIDPSNRTRDEVLASVARSLQRLDVDTIDLLLVHWPHPLADVKTTMRAMNEARDRGWVDHLGVSNFGVDRLRDARRHSEAPIVTNQVQFHPHQPQRRLLRYCQDRGILLTAYSPLAHGGLLADEELRRVARRYDKTPAQVAIRWAIQHAGVVAVPKATTRDHLAENIDVFDFSLSREEVERLARPSKILTALSFLRGRFGR